MDSIKIKFIILTFAIVIGEIVKITNGGKYNSYINVKIHRNFSF